MKSANLIMSLNIIFLAFGGIAYAADRDNKRTETAKATFAGGCFWSVELLFDKVDGVLSTISGYTGGAKKNPTYDQVVTGRTGHAESVQITYDPKKVSYEKLLDVFWHNIDPLTPDAQFCDAGSQYRTAVFYHDETQKRLGEKSKKALQGRFKQLIVTQIVPVSQFYPAEDYHQDFHLKNPVRYQLYRAGCGRDRRLEELWGAERK
ncbi:MAG: peptide-methionine (S)-S-oxide reductase [Deltaproteobacteria bacterium GWA2_57_13]|nr:MAG: peptide-methionine (S)-S-oxide reductase [Deltaproteobacteria bacterium GWA2_57_13]OGQ51254.1 MAG: peptide-methionine (S)-S-oxide reductase [Deltaproteobacteria bacterium RIFCSPLOWO2_02_FULL_57_26]